MRVNAAVDGSLELVLLSGPRYCGEDNGRRASGIVSSAMISYDAYLAVTYCEVLDRKEDLL